MATARKKKNVFVRYFTPFGLKQVCDLVMLAGFVLLIVGLCVSDAVLIAGFICYALGAIGAIVRCCMVMFDTENRRDPKYKTAVINIVIMGVLLALAIFGLVWTIIR